MKDNFHIVIVGAGMVGLTLATLLRASQERQHISLTILDAARKPAFDVGDEVGLRVSAISLGSARTLSDAGAWEKIKATRACPYRDMRVWDSVSAAEAPDALQFDAADFAVPELGHIAENMLIQCALLKRLKDMDQPVKFDTSIRDVERVQDRYRLELSDSQTINADLLVGADGGRSFVRDAAGISVKDWHYPQTAFVTHLEPELSHRNTAWQRFLRAGPVALLPLSDGRVSTVWSTTPADAQDALQASDMELGERLSAATDHVLGKLTPAGPRGTFPLRGQHATHYVLPGLALVGDAAHSVHPLAGQGVNLGIADAETLASTIIAAIREAEHPGDMPVLRRYERARKGANSTMLLFVDGINRLFAAESPTVGAARRAGMRLFNASGPVRERAVQVALGITH